MEIVVKHHAGKYPVRLCRPEEAFLGLPQDSFVITDENVFKHWSVLIRPGLRTLVLEPGEHSKRISEFQKVCEWLAESGATRSSTVIAFGGGVVGDLAGFAAAAYMRGVNLVQIPTTLLALVDSSVGGKVGVDLNHGKNLVGAFKPPIHVLASTGFLVSLPERQIRNGFSEVLKYGFIADPGILDRASQIPTEELVRRCIEIKAAIVESDEFEKSGLRATLNFGHTVGHAIEAALCYEQMLHGEAVAVGMVAEAEIGERLGVSDSGTRREVEARISAAGLPVRLPGGIAPDKLVEFMARDKKAAPGELKMSLLLRVGECKLVGSVPEETVRQVLAKL